MRALPLALLTALAGCPAHVMLDAPPPPSAPVEMRTAYYEQHMPEPPERGEFVVRTRVFEHKPSFTQKTLHMHNGVRIDYVEDLRPLVPEESDTARAIDTSVDARGRADLTTGIGMGLAGVGLAAGGGLIADYLLQQGLNQQGNTIDPLLIAGVVAIAVGAVGGGGVVSWGMLIRNDEEDARTQAFKSVDAAMRKKLGLDEAK